MRKPVQAQAQAQPQAQAQAQPQPQLGLTPPIRCVRCDGTGSAYYIAGRGIVIGGKRIVCPDCDGTGWVGAQPVGELRDA